MEYATVDRTEEMKNCKIGSGIKRESYKKPRWLAEGSQRGDMLTTYKVMKEEIS